MPFKFTVVFPDSITVFFTELSKFFIIGKTLATFSFKEIFNSEITFETSPSLNFLLKCSFKSCFINSTLISDCIFFSAHLALFLFLIKTLISSSEKLSLENNSTNFSPSSDSSLLDDITTLQL